ncbi:MAG: DUF4307 domain-containing protein [Mycobacterium sp.]
MTDRPPARYGRQPTSRRPGAWMIAGLTLFILAAGVGVAVVGYHRLGRSDVEGTLAAYELIDGETVQVTITVTRENPSRPAVCIVRGRSKDGSETGRREVLVPPATEKSVQVTTFVKTARPPVVGDVYGCGLDVPGYLVAP